MKGVSGPQLLALVPPESPPGQGKGVVLVAELVGLLAAVVPAGALGKVSYKRISYKTGPIREPKGSSRPTVVVGKVKRPSVAPLWNAQSIGLVLICPLPRWTPQNG